MHRMHIVGSQDLSRVLNTHICAYMCVSAFAKLALGGTEVEACEVGTETVFPRCAALPTACCCMLACLPQNEPFPQEEAGLYEYTAERSDLPIRPSLSKLFTPQRCCYYTP